MGQNKWIRLNGSTVGPLHGANEGADEREGEGLRAHLTPVHGAAGVRIRNA